MASDASGLDLNLHLGLPPLPRHQSRDLGSDLTLSPLPLSPSSAEEIRSLAGMPGAFEQPVFQTNYSPSNALSTPELVPMDPLGAAANSLTLEHRADLPSVEPDGTPHAPALQIESDAPYSLPHVRASTEPDQPLALRILPLQNEAAVPISPYLTVRMSELVARDDGRRELLECPELRFQRLIESNNRLRARRFRLTSTMDSERSDSQTSPDRLMHDIMRSQRTLEASKKDKLHAQGKAMEDDSEKDKEDENAANFECNICFEMAKEPVVTPCGHLFCWPCLYQWLHAHSVYSECPVCKGEVLEVNVTPIYGRGGSNATAKKVSGEDGGSELKIPPRPLAHRTESTRQQLQRPVSRRLGEESATSWRQIIGEDVHNVVTVEEIRGLSSRFPFDGLHGRALITRLRRLRMQREEGSGSNVVGIDLPDNTEPNPQSHSTNSLSRDGIDLSQQSPFEHASTGRLRARLRGRSAGGRASPSVNPPSPEPLHHRHAIQPTLTTEQASASSTMAVIQGDITATDISAEPSGAGSSRSLRRRGRLSTSGSLDADGTAFNARRRRRLN